ncbi:ZF-HD homeobox protein [Acorus calamus]|uniref:ZF-HD homeobox protein n=1 Tax=Acorus calamus TaxID=4465 RepID=A0AAV9CE57_ACOCL|nr:ZF-HD homeobox protein [Acorus calamus]
MDLPNHESGLPIPISTTFGGGNHPHIIHGPPPPPPPPPPPTLLDIDPYNTTTNNNKVTVKYRECLKNHAAAMGGNATDGCGEFMPSGEEGTMDALSALPAPATGTSTEKTLKALLLLTHHTSSSPPLSSPERLWVRRGSSLHLTHLGTLTTNTTTTHNRWSCHTTWLGQSQMSRTSTRGGLGW